MFSHSPAIAPDPARPAEKGTPERGLVRPPEVPAEFRVIGDCSAKTKHCSPSYVGLLVAASVPPASPVRLSAPVAWSKLPVISPMSKSTVTSALIGSLMCVSKSGTPRVPLLIAPVAGSIWAAKGAVSGASKRAASESCLPTFARASVKVIESGSALAAEAKTPSARSETRAATNFLGTIRSSPCSFGSAPSIPALKFLKHKTQFPHARHRACRRTGGGGSADPPPLLSADPPPPVLNHLPKNRRTPPIRGRPQPPAWAFPFRFRPERQAPARPSGRALPAPAGSSFRNQAPLLRRPLSWSRR